MKTEDRIRNKLINALQEMRVEVVQAFNDYQRVLESPTVTVEEIMAAKASFLYRYVNEIPITSKHCYFCRLYFRRGETECPICPYGRLHGVCDCTGSSWKTIRLAINDLNNAIVVYYPLGESYDPPVVPSEA
jgi:hypothetical protein